MLPEPFPGGPVPIPYPNVTSAGASGAPPAVRGHVPKELLSPEFQTILARLAERFGSKLNVTPADPEWVEISVANISPAQLHAELQNARNTLFGNAAVRVQVIQPGSPGSASIFLHLLSEPNWGDVARFSGK